MLNLETRGTQAEEGSFFRLERQILMKIHLGTDGQLASKGPVQVKHKVHGFLIPGLDGVVCYTCVAESDLKDGVLV